MENLYDLIILGSGPAGLSAGMYSARSNFNTLIIEKGSFGGQIINTSEIANYPGVIGNETGSDLANKMIKQCKDFGVEFIKDTIIEIDIDSRIKIIKSKKSIYRCKALIIATGSSPKRCKDFGVEFIKDTIIEIDIDSRIKIIKSKKSIYRCKALIIATGSSPKRLGVPNEKEFIGKGVSYCAICDGDFFEDLEVFVVGSGDSAVKEGIFLSKYARKVNIISRSEKLHAYKELEKKAKENKKINFIFNTCIKRLYGDGILQSIEFKNLKNNKIERYTCSKEDGLLGLFIFIGFNPNTNLFKDKLHIDELGYINSDEYMKTNIEGVFVAGDCRQKALRQVITAASDGAIASLSAQKYIEDNEVV